MRRHRHAIIANHGGVLDIGSDVEINSRPERTHLVVGFNGRLSIGDHVRIGQGVAVSCDYEITIGSHSTLCAYTMVADSDFHVAGDHQAPVVPRPITIGRRVSIGPHSIILPGATIDDDATVAPASVVGGHVAAGSKVAGNPATVTSDRHPTTQTRSVPELVAGLFGLDTPPDSNVSTADIRDWDSLGTLRLLCAVEAEYSIVVDERQISTFSTIGDWESLQTSESVGQE